AFSQYFTTFLIGGGLIKTLPMVLIPYIQSGDRTLASVYSILFIASSLLVLIVLEKIVSIHYKKSFYL
ncbi:MAG TPA: ABC transporter permease, partial [Clostridium sp.]|nr:ABC transporter permease [Clostridium sp.]